MKFTQTYRLGDVAEVQTGPFGSQLHMEDYVNEGTPIITAEHLGENRILHNNLPRRSGNKLLIVTFWHKFYYENICLSHP